MSVFPLADLLDRQRAGGAPWHEFLQSPDMSAGLYVLEAGAVDRQLPHTEDEVYVVLAGRAAFTDGDRESAVGPGDTIFVPAGVVHRFHDITETLHLVVVFAPPEGSRAR